MNESHGRRAAPSADLIRAIQERHERRSRKDRLVQERMGTSMFGLLSMAIGLFVMFVALAGLIGGPLNGLTVPYPIMEAGEVEYSRSPWTNRMVARPVEFVEGRTIEVPSKACAVMVLVGIGLGATGVVLEQRKNRRRGVVLSVAGALLCALAIGLPLLVCVTLNLSVW